MMNIRPLGFSDISTPAAWYVTKYRKNLDPETSMLVLRAKGEDQPILSEWKSMAAFLTKLRNEAAPLNDGKPAELGNVYIHELPAGAHLQWTRHVESYDLGHFHVRICMVPSVGHWLYYGGDAVILAMGQLAEFNVQALHSELNIGPCAGVHLCCDVKKPTVAGNA